MIKTGVMLMSNRGPDGQPWDWREALKRWQKLGLQGVDIFHGMLKANNETPQSIKQVLDDLGLKPSVYGVPTNLVSPDPADRATSLDTVKAGIDACGVLGIKHLFSHGGQHNNEGEESFLRYMDGLETAASLARDAGLLFSIENAGKMCNSGDSLTRVLDLVRQPNMRITFDGGNFITRGYEPHDAIMALRAKVGHVHVKSHVPAPPGSDRQYLYCPTGEGHPDYRFIRDRLLEVGYQGWMSFEPEGGFDSKWDQSIATLAQIVAEANTAK